MNTINNKIGISIIGTTSFGAKELLRLLEHHPYAQIAQLVSHSHNEKPLKSIHQNISRTLEHFPVDAQLDIEKLDLFENKFVVLSLASEHSAEFIKQHYNTLTKKNISIIDLSGCCRIRDNFQRKKNYPESEDIIDQIPFFQYGLPEIYLEKIKRATHISNPGCYATAAILSVHPLSDLPILSISIDGKSGSSGAGKSLQQNFHHPLLHANSFPYKGGAHRHEPEITENLKINSIENLIFCPHVIPVSRGMLVTSYLVLKEKVSQEYIKSIFEKAYKDRPFIRLKDEPAQIINVVGSNFCDIHTQVRENIVIVTATIDNLVKGMAGQAIQNINIQSCIPEDSGLNYSALGIV